MAKCNYVGRCPFQELNTEREVAYKWIIRDNQQTNFEEFILTDKYYSCEDAVKNDYKHGIEEHCFRIIEPFLMSRQTGELAWKLTEHERRGK